MLFYNFYYKISYWEVHNLQILNAFSMTWTMTCFPAKKLYLLGLTLFTTLLLVYCLTFIFNYLSRDPTMDLNSEHFDLGCSSSEVQSSQVTLVYVKLAMTTNHDIREFYQNLGLFLW